MILSFINICLVSRGVLKTEGVANINGKSYLIHILNNSNLIIHYISENLQYLGDLIAKKL